MTPERLDAIQARADAATEGPWKAYDRGILCRRRRKCIAQGYHTEGGNCPACGT